MNGEGHPYQVEPSEDTYWQARHELAAAARALNETVVSTDISLDTATEITEAMRQLTQRLKKEPQLTGFVDMARRKDRGSIDNVMGELVAIAGRSHPSAPALTWHEEPNRIVGEVVFGPAFEGPPGHAHGGWVAGILDHLMGMTHVKTGRPGMTSGLSVRYLKPTPLNTKIHINAETTEIDERRTEVTASMRVGDTLTATAEAIFVRVDAAKFGLDAEDSR